MKTPTLFGLSTVVIINLKYVSVLVRMRLEGLVWGLVKDLISLNMHDELNVSLIRCI
jgi:hypothetical protein